MPQDFNRSENSACQNILIIEDSEPDLFLLEKQINKVWPGNAISHVKSVGEAYGKFKNNNFDLILLDLNLPDGFGPNTVQEVRKFNKNVPIIVITGIGTEMTYSQALKMGANSVILKSQITDDDFIDILRQNVTAIN